MKSRISLFLIMTLLTGLAALAFAENADMDIEQPIITLFSVSEKTIDPEIYPCLEGTDNSGITGWLINQSSDLPEADSPDWAAQSPAVFNLGDEAGIFTLYAWVKDAAGNISQPQVCSIAYIIDKNPPVITTFYFPRETATAEIYISLEGVDDVGITGWILQEEKKTPAINDPDWTAEVPYNYFLKKGPGLYNFYAWAKDESGNISKPAAACTVYMEDKDSPVISRFNVPFETSLVNIQVILDGFDDRGITGWIISESDNKPSVNDPEWMPQAPYNYTLQGECGTYVLYAWAKDDAGNISQPISGVINYYNEADELSYGN